MISVVVITRNEERNIQRTLVSLACSSISEVIVSDSNSTDRTGEIVGLFSRKDSRVSFHSFASGPFTAARGRNEGALCADATSEYLLFLDGDMELVPDFLDFALKELTKDPCLAAVCGQMDNCFYSDAGGLARVERNVYDISENAPGGAFLIRRNAFYDAGMFNPELIVNEESEFFLRLRRLGLHMRRYEQPMIIHHTETPVSRSRLKERLMDRKITALGINLFFALRDPGYLKILFRDNKFTFLCLFGIFIAAALCLSGYFVGGLLFLSALWLFVSLANRSFRVAMNYEVYAVGVLFGLISFSLRRFLVKASATSSRGCCS